MKLKALFSAAALAAVVSVSAMADDIPYANPGTVAPTDTFTATSTGDLVGYFYGSTALNDSLVGVYVNGQQLGTFGLDNHSSNFGDPMDFGPVNAGDSITFALQVQGQGYTVYSDPNWNSDGVNHVYATNFSGATQGDVTIPSGVFIGFEDELLPNSDLNYDDGDYVFTNVTATDPMAADPTATPEPASIALLGLGLLPFGFRALRKKRQ